MTGATGAGMRLLIVYSTIDGHTLEICERIAAIARATGHEVELAEVESASAEQLEACDRIVIIDKGRIAADGSTESLKQGSGGEHTIHLSLLGADFEEASRAIGAIDGVSRVERVEGANVDELRLRIFAGGPDRLREKIYACVKATDWIMVELTQEGKSLEKIFRDLTREV